MPTNQNLPQEFNAVRDKDEQILWAGRPVLAPFLLTGIPFLMIGLIWGSIDYFGFIRQMKGIPAGFAIPFFALHLFPLWGGIANMARLVLVSGNTFYAFTNKRLMMRSGFWGTDFKTVDYDKITNMEVDVNPIENMMGAGTIRAYSGSTNSRGNPVADQFTAIQQPYDVFKRIKEASVDVKTDWNYPNALRPNTNPGYKTKYEPR